MRKGAALVFTGAVAMSLVLAGCTGEGATQGKDKGSAAPSGGAENAGAPSREARAAPRPPKSVAALGDSITRGFHACEPLTDCPEKSWSTGDSQDVDSLAQRLLDKPSGHTWNFARSGAQVADLPVQTGEAIARRPDLVTILMGANDACTKSAEEMTPVADYRTAVADSLDRLESDLPRTQVYVSSVPSLMRLWEVGRGSTVTRQIWSLGICQSMLADPSDLGATASSRREEVQDRVVEYNAVLAEECGKHPLCVYDDGAAFRYAFTGDHLSRWDSFHPDEDGQNVLAEIAYKKLREAREG
ncbi:GDSL-type esterase/lipase family protein [Streptomyces sp. NBC_01808]|uniref:SGNH/GDSL hydrolase family protein n=1 Tax=Streptomyces sp. NBC_01808 TaxID=2975947 RepID=UPI002DDC16A9|nr:SGNH/GDSL hydrolase family protein [Streptomyces sp. NBC_01808]WSA37594.1 GDSL-type esterase/lipase family protein [Streptomyces sp. NBC_01808]